MLPTMYPAGLAIPMVAPADLGAAAARLLREFANRTGTHHIERPEGYMPDDVADAFARALGCEMRVEVTPRDHWEAAYRKLGFSEAAAVAYARMVAVSVDGAYEPPSVPERGPTTLDRYVEALVPKA